MAKPQVYIDGQAGTTGLRIRTLLAERRDLEVIEIEPARRKDRSARRELLNAADLAILCLPDDAAREAVAMVDRAGARILDASTAHRVAEGWVYGLPELAPTQRGQIAEASRVSNPGCYPTGVALLLRPLVEAGLIPASAPIFVHALSGYTGGGKAMIANWEDPDGGLVGLPFEGPYAYERMHKHIPEMTRYANLASHPHFVPAVGPFACGMRIQVPLHAATMQGTDAKALHAALTARYQDERCIRVHPLGQGPSGEPTEPTSLDPRSCNGTNRVELSVLPHPDGHATLLAILDNLGKGASGAAVQNLNLMLGLDEHAGLKLD
ncbi:MAG: N-acetyl-gamma-glutamyl-phosphate reductase [Myxococcales bacterium]|nr:N-acetyl-gamma-glutamyl-phosphate reductase [Myxococcales bacterium]